VRMTFLGQLCKKAAGAEPAAASDAGCALSVGGCRVR
jgi:hypothetical protein